VLNGEAAMLLYGDFSVKDWALLWFTGAYGGVRIVSQFALLVHTSATTLALSNVTIQALTTILGIFLFGTPVTNFLVAGVSVTLLTTAGYTYVKTSKVLEPKKGEGPLL
jgi:drug/metabolite transporter (DMT)-like permease